MKLALLALLAYSLGLAAMRAQSVPGSYPYPRPLPTNGPTPWTQSIVRSPLAPANYADTHPVAWDVMLGGGHRSVGTLAERNAIPTGRRKEGMTVYVQEDGRTYRLGSDLATWSEAHVPGYYIAADDSARYTLGPLLKNGDVVFQSAVNPTWAYNQNWLLVDRNYATNSAGWVTLGVKPFVIYSGGTVDPTYVEQTYLQGIEFVGHSIIAVPNNSQPFVSFEAYDTDGLDGVFALQPFGGTLTYIDVSNNNLTEFDMTGLTTLETLYLYNNFITGTFSAPDSAEMTELDISNNLYTDFDGTGLTSLPSLYFGQNPLTNFFGGDMTSMTILDFTPLEFSFPLLETFTAGNMTALTDLFLNPFIFGSTSALRSVDISGCSQLELVDVHYATLVTNIVWPTNNSVLAYAYMNGCRSLPYPPLALTNYASLIEVGFDVQNGTVGPEWDGMQWQSLYASRCRSFAGSDLPSLSLIQFIDDQGTLQSFNGQGLTSLTTLALTGQESSLTNFVSGNMGGTNGSLFEASYFTNLVNIDLSGIQYVQAFTLLDCGSSTNYHLPTTGRIDAVYVGDDTYGWTADTFYINPGANVGSIFILAGQPLQSVVADNALITGMNITDGAATHGTNVAHLSIYGSTNILSLLVPSQALTSASVNNTLTNLAWFGLSNGVVNLSGGTSATTNAAGSAAVDTLVSRGWTVVNN